MIYTLHGWSFDRAVWKNTPFEGALHLELPGHGESPFTSTTLLELSKEVASYLPENSTLVGWSLGATVALLVGALYPAKVRELILYAPTPLFSGLSQPEAVVKRFLKRLKRDFSEGVRFFRALCSKKGGSVPKINPEVAVALLEDFCYFNATGYFKKLTRPVKIVVGEEDEITKVVGAFSGFKLSNSATLTLLPQKDHLTVLQYAI